MSKTTLPLVLEDEILARVPFRSLARFRTVCQRWNTLFGDKIFIKQRLAYVRPEFILQTHEYKTNDYKIYSVSINFDGSLQMREFNLETQCQKKLKLYENRRFCYCDGLLLCPAMRNKLAIWNPWLRQQTKWVEPMRYNFNLYGIGYDNSRPDKGYKIMGLRYSKDHVDGMTIIVPKVLIYDFATSWWNKLEFGSIDWELMSPPAVSLNGTLYWIAVRVDSNGDCFVQSFDFSAEKFKPFCLSIPCTGGTKVLQVFKGDRLSILEQCMTTKEVKIWVTKNRIRGDSNEHVSWKVLMTVSIPNFPTLQVYIDNYNTRPSYFIDNNDDKRLIVCTCDEIGKPYIYIVKGDRFKKIQMGLEVDAWPLHLVYVPTLVSVP